MVCESWPEHDTIDHQYLCLCFSPQVIATLTVSQGYGLKSGAKPVTDIRGWLRDNSVCGSYTIAVPF
ncbi:hypothetical protein QUA40_12940 [Microcoleus sp. Pol11C3]|uniref:hypothetical protein n=1 Tax=Microcoleus sp. Pol11C3 TaxID=3055390 RepID=UPI002FD06A3F